ncbi:MAG: glycosyltransferase family 4 protein [Planctomycetota bacterium]|nr:glycosyltransferase family 4 protein [Planctomycetota bacterium]
MHRVAVLFEFNSLNGGEHSLLTALDQLSAEPFEFVALAPVDGRLAEALQQRGIQHVPLSLRDQAGNRLPRAQVCERIKDAIKDVSPNVVHANSLSMGRLTGAIANQLEPHCVAHLRDILKLSRTAIEDLNQNSVLLAVSQATRTFHIEQGMRAERVRVLHNGVDCDRFRPRNRTGSLQRELGLPNDSFLVATIGQIGLRKGQDVLAEAAVLAADRLANVHYLVIGERLSWKAESIEFEQALIDRFNTSGLGGRLHRLGYRSDIDRLMNEVDLLVHPAHQEPLGRVLLEAAASGLPIIATAVGGTEEILCNGESARLVPPADPPSLSAAIVELHGAAAKRLRYAVAARKRVETAFNAQGAARELAAVWSEIVS